MVVVAFQPHVAVAFGGGPEGDLGAEAEVRVGAGVVRVERDQDLHLIGVRGEVEQGGGGLGEGLGPAA